MDNQRDNRKQEHPEVIEPVVVKRIDGEEGVDVGYLDDRNLQKNSADKRNPEHRVLVGEDHDEALLRIGHAEHVEQFGESQHAEGHRLSLLDDMAHSQLLGLLEEGE